MSPDFYSFVCGQFNNRKLTEADMHLDQLHHNGAISFEQEVNKAKATSSTVNEFASQIRHLLEYGDKYAWHTLSDELLPILIADQQHTNHTITPHQARAEDVLEAFKRRFKSNHMIWGPGQPIVLAVKQFGKSYFGQSEYEMEQEQPEKEDIGSSISKMFAILGQKEGFHEEKTVLELYIFEDLTPDEIAAKLGWPKHKVHVRLENAKIFVKRYLSKDKTFSKMLDFLLSESKASVFTKLAIFVNKSKLLNR